MDVRARLKIYILHEQVSLNFVHKEREKPNTELQQASAKAKEKKRMKLKEYNCTWKLRLKNFVFSEAKAK